MARYHHRHPLSREHKVKIVITCGILVSTTITIIYPEYQYHSAILAIGTNLLWVWS